MVQMEVVSTHNGSLPAAGLVKNKNSNGMVKAVGNGSGGQEGKAPRKLTKNEKRRQKNKQKKAQASEGAVMDKSMAESNGVAVASWPPPADKEGAADVQVGVVHGAFVYGRVRVGFVALAFWSLVFRLKGQAEPSRTKKGRAGALMPVFVLVRGERGWRRLHVCIFVISFILLGIPLGSCTGAVLLVLLCRGEGWRHSISVKEYYCRYLRTCSCCANGHWY